MPIRVACPACGNILRAPDAAAGKKGRCAKCGSSVPIPEADSPTPPTTAPVPAASPAKPVAPTPPVAESFDVDFVDDDPPPAPVRSIPVVAVVPTASAPPVAVVPVIVSAPVAPPPPPAAPAGDVWSTFDPPPDSAASMLSSDSEFDTHEVVATEEKLPPLHPGWREVARGFGMIKNSVYALFVCAVLFALASVTAGLGSPFGYVFSGVAGVVWLICMVIGLIGLIRCIKMPPDDQGGAGRSLAMLTLGLLGGGVVLSCIGIGILAIFAIPFTFGMFLRTIGKELTHAPTSQAAMRFMVVAGLWVVAFLTSLIVVVIVPPILLASKVSQNVVLAVLLVTALGVLMMNLLSLFMLLSALTNAQKGIGESVRHRGVSEELAGPDPSKSKPAAKSRKRVEEDEDDEEEADEPPAPPPPTKSSARRKPKTTSNDDDYNPFA